MTIFKGFKRHNTIKKKQAPALRHDINFKEQHQQPDIDLKSLAEQKSEEQAIKNRHNTTKIVEVGGPKGLEPTRYGDWEKAGRCSDF